MAFTLAVKTARRHSCKLMSDPSAPPSKKESTPALRARAEAALVKGDLATAQTLASELAGRTLGGWDQAVLGRIALAAGHIKEANTHLEAARALLPDEGSILVDLAAALAASRRWAAAAKVVAEAIAQRGHLADLHERHAIYLANAGDREGSKMALEHALTLEPHRASAWALLGERHLEQGERAAAKTAFAKAVTCDPKDPSGLWNLALLAEQEGDLEDAASILTQLLETRADQRQVRHRRGQIRLSRGDLEQGWADYAFRLKSREYVSWQHALKAPYWAGEDLTGKHLAVWADQGLGEQLLTASLLPDVLSQSKSLTFACDPRLVTLLRRSFPEVQVVSLEALKQEGKALGAIDYQATLSEVGAAQRPSLSDFPSPQATLLPDSGRVAAFRESLLAGAAKPLIGIAWRSENALAGREKRTDLPSHWLPLLKTPEVQFISLQYGQTGDEIAAANAAAGCDITSIPGLDPIRDVDGFAALVAAMDLMISTSNTTVHIAGGLGKPCWALLPRAYGRPWYWFDKGEASLWYENLTLLSSQGDWTEVAREASKRLKHWVGS
jgi:tetratricopeptide (TPR) repeat protein